MTDQGSEMVSLPQGVILEKPKSLTGVINTDAVNDFIFQVEWYSWCELGKGNIFLNNKVSERKLGPFEHAQSMSKWLAG